jgi:hypothetical protein
MATNKKKERMIILRKNLLLETAVETDNAEVIKTSQDSLSKPVKSPYQSHLSSLDLKQRHLQVKALGAEGARTN